MVERYFQEVILFMDENIKHGAGAYSNYLDKLQEVHRAIVSTSKEGVCPEHTVHLQTQEHADTVVFYFAQK